jgi:hypothetical protein
LSEEGSNFSDSRFDLFEMPAVFHGVSLPAEAPQQILGSLAGRLSETQGSRKGPVVTS